TSPTGMDHGPRIARTLCPRAWCAAARGTGRLSRRHEIWCIPFVLPLCRRFVSQSDAIPHVVPHAFTGALPGNRNGIPGFRSALSAVRTDPRMDAPADGTLLRNHLRLLRHC